LVDLTDSELIAYILSLPGEDRRTEFKRLGGTFDVKKTMESIVALTNTDGGYMVFGVDDPEKTRVKGLDRVFGIEENPDKFDEIGRNIERIVPPTSINWPPRLVTCAENRTIGLLPIPKATDSFHSINNHVYIRLEKGNKLLTPLEIIKLSYAKGFHQADRELVDVDFDLLKTDHFESWRKARGISPGNLKEILFHTGLARKDKTGLLKPTRAGVLLFALYPHNLMDTKCTIRVFQYTGTNEQVKDHTLNLIGTPKTIDGPITKQIKDAHD
jgi:ATP-dependent DNA helicase RecG